MKIKNQSGFSVLEALLILVIVGILGFTGWFVWHSKQNVDKTNIQSVVASQSNVTATVDNTKYWDCFANMIAAKPSAIVSPKDNSCTVCINGINTNSGTCVKKGVTIQFPKPYTPESIMGYSKLPYTSTQTVDRIARQNHDITFPTGSCSGNELPAYIGVISVTDNSKLVKLESYPRCGDPNESLVYNDNGTWVEGVGAGGPATYQCSFVDKYKIPYDQLYKGPGETKPGCYSEDNKAVTVSY